MGGAMLHVSSTGEMLGALERASDIDARAYTLHGAALEALEAAAERGAHVSVELEGRPHNDPKGRLAAENRRLVGELRAAGADAQLGDPVHAKVITADGTFYFDDKNWGTRDLVLREDDPAVAASIPLVKHEALAAEARLLRDARAGDGVIVASESFGRFNAVYSALDELGRRGGAPRLIVGNRELRGNARERDALATLARDGVCIRIADDSEKLAVAGDRAWIGSANATVAFGRADLPDWGVCTDDPTIARAIADRVESEWTHAKVFRTPN
jgi:hypothetical protein